MTPKPPLCETDPVVGVRSPAMILSRVVFTGTVGTDQGDDGTLTNTERHVVQQHSPVGEVIAHPCEIDVSHGRPC
jgi:hypothetical protein